MAAAELIKEEMLIDCGFSFSVGNNILESSNNMSEQSPYGSEGKSTTSQLKIMNTVKRKGPRASNKTRKSSSQIEIVKTTSLTDDGYGWRKYGQKVIHNNPHPKSYYRCTHHVEEKCEAKKWVQKESDNPPIYNTTYLGHHTCQNPLKIPQIFLPYTPSGYLSSTPDNNNTDSFDHHHYSSPNSKPILLCFDSPSSNQQYFTGQMGFSSLPSSPPTDHDTMMFADQTTINESGGMNMDVSMQQGLDEIFKAYENGCGMIGATPEDYYACYLPPMESPSCNFGSYEYDMMVEELLDRDNCPYLE